MTLPDLVLHVGMPQTSGTMLQRALTRMRPQLREHGVAYLSHDAIMQFANVHGWLANPKPVPSRAGAFEEELAAARERACRETREASTDGAVHTVLLSSHGLLGRAHVGRPDASQFRPQAVPAIEQTIRALGAETVRLVCHVRRQDELMEYSYMQEVMGGRHHSFAHQFPYQFEPALNYVDLIERISAIDAVTETTVFAFERTRYRLREALDELLGTVNLAGRLDGEAAGRLSLGRIYSSRGMRVALGMNPYLDWSEERGLVRDFVLRTFPANHRDDSRFLDAATRRRILEVYASSNQTLFSRYLPELPADTYVDDEHTDEISAMPAPPRSSGRAARSGGLMAFLVRRARRLRRRAARRTAG